MLKLKKIKNNPRSLKKNTMTNKHILLNIALAIALIISLRQCNSYKMQKQENQRLIEAMNDTVKFWKDKNGESHYIIQALETDNSKKIISLQTKDKEILKLQEAVKEYQNKINKGGAVTVFETINKIDTVLVAQADRDTLRFFLSDKWVDMEMTIYQKKEMELAYLFRDEFKIITGKDKGKAFVEITSLNPHSTVKNLRSYINTPKEKNKNWGIGPYIGYGIGSNGLTPTVGVGLQYNVLKF